MRESVSTHKETRSIRTQSEKWTGMLVRATKKFFRFRVCGAGAIRIALELARKGETSEVVARCKRQGKMWNEMYEGREREKEREDGKGKGRECEGTQAQAVTSRNLRRAKK